MMCDMTPRLGRALALVGLVGGGLVALGVAPAYADYRWCSDVGDVAPCIVSASRDGVAITDHTAVNRDEYSVSDVDHYTGWTLNYLTSADLGHTYKVVLKTGSIKPRVVSGWGAQGHATRSQDSSGDWFSTVTLRPVRMLMSCNNPSEPYCPFTASPPDDRIEAHVDINDASWYSADPAEADKIDGLEQYSNINLFWYPPTITTSSTGVVTMDFLLENSHEDASHVAFRGQANVRLPNKLLRLFYGIPAPETMVDGSFTSTTTSGSIASYQETGDDAWRIDLTGVTFSKQHLKLKRGVITPTRPTITKATRATATSAKLAYTLSKPRGARVTGYDARCVSPSGQVVSRTKTVPTSPIVVGNLKRGTAYTCRVRARSKVGPGGWSLAAKVRARP
jgi:hypothetical protein